MANHCQKASEPLLEGKFPGGARPETPQMDADGCIPKA